MYKGACEATTKNFLRPQEDYLTLRDWGGPVPHGTDTGRNRFLEEAWRFVREIEIGIYLKAFKSQLR